MKQVFIYCMLVLLSLKGLLAQQAYNLQPNYPVHELDTHLRVYPDSLNRLSPTAILNDSSGDYTLGSELPRFLDPDITYWGKLKIKATDSLTGWKLHLEDKMIGPPAWSKSNGKVDVYAFVGKRLIFHQKTGVEYPKNERSQAANWVLNSISMESIPLNTEVTLVIKTQGNSFGYPPYFHLSARGPSQPYYHQIYQYHNTFNTFMFGVTFIVFLYFFLQFVYLRERIYFWFSLWLFLCSLTQAMTIGLIINVLPEIRYPFYLFIANGIFFTFWFFGRSFIQSKQKFPKLDRLILGLAFFILAEIVLTTLYVLIFNPNTFFTSPGKHHYVILNIYTVGSLILSVVLTLKKDLFARYFGVGSLIASIFLVIGTLWSMGLIIPPFRMDPYGTGLLFQIVIYSFGMAYRSQKINQQNQEERLRAERSLAEITRMKDLDQIKTRFFANISHEFRTPLSLIKGPLEQARKKSANGSDSVIMLSGKAYGVIQKNTHRLQNLVDQLLDLSKIESGNLELNLSRGGLMQFLRSQVFSFESLAERKNISLNTHFSEEPATSYYDQDKLEKIVNNLISNAFKYTSQGGAVHVNVKHNQKNVMIEISDTGHGIQQEEIDRIFDRFYRVEGSEAKGSGIGLALTKELVDLHNGQISVHSEKGRGTTFKLRLPINLKDLPQSIVVDTDELVVSDELLPTIPSKEKDNGKVVMEKDHEHLVLLVEDNADLQAFVSEILEPHYKVIQAMDGLQGERMAFEHIPDLIISDVMMPKKDGYELCHSVKTNIKTSHIPVIILTAKAGQTNKMAGLTQGADAYLTKPFDADELLLRTKNLIDARKKIWEHFKSLDLSAIGDLELSAADDKFLQKVVSFINENIDNELLSVEDIASQVGFSRAQLHRKLKALTDKSAGKLVNEIRLNTARTMLSNQVGSVSEVAYSVGFSNMSYFTKSFKEKFGVLPSKV